VTEFSAVPAYTPDHEHDRDRHGKAGKDQIAQQDEPLVDPIELAGVTDEVQLMTYA